MTYSIVGRDPDTGEVGIAVQSHYFGAGAVVPWLQAGVGAVATQAVARAAYGRDGLVHLQAGLDPEQALDRMRRADPNSAVRQVAVMDVAGRSAGFTGEGCVGAAGHSVSPNARAQANMVAGQRVWESMTEAFESSSGTLAQRLLDALRAAESHGGDLRGRQAAAIKVVRGEAVDDPMLGAVTDVRVDDSTDPLGDLARLLDRSTALSGLVRLLDTDGLFAGPFTAPDAVVVGALDELERGQRSSGPDNLEATIWRGLLLARAGRTEEARTAFGLARTAGMHVDAFVRRLAEAGMWDRSGEELDDALGAPYDPAVNHRAAPSRIEQPTH